MGQDVIKTTLGNQIMTGGIAHAYLFSGPRGTGKTTTARLLAKALNCTARAEGSSEPCNTCALCMDITRGTCMDVLEIDAASHTGVENVRENIIDATQFRPTFARYKVFIIDEVHMLSAASFNALLKTLEEPPAHVVFILATTELHKLPATILSRCERYQFKRIGATEMRTRLLGLAQAEGVTIEPAVLERIIQLSEGGMRDAESLMGQCLALGEKNITRETVEHILPSTYDRSIIDFLGMVFAGTGAPLLELLDRLHLEGTNWPHFMNALLEEFKNALVYKVAGSHNGVLVGNKELMELINNVPLARLIELTDSLIARKGQMIACPIPHLPLELWVAEHFISDAAIPLPNRGATMVTHIEPAEKAAPPAKPVAEALAPKPLAEEKKTEEIVAEVVISEPEPELLQPSTQPVADLDTVRLAWQNCVDHICTEFPSLSFILKAADLDAWDGERLTLSFDYALHKDKILEHKIRGRIEHIIKEKHGLKVLLNGRVRNTKTVMEEKIDPALEKLSAALGGQMVG